MLIFDKLKELTRNEIIEGTEEITLRNNIRSNRISATIVIHMIYSLFKLIVSLRSELKDLKNELNTEEAKETPKTEVKKAVPPKTTKKKGA